MNNSKFIPTFISDDNYYIGVKLQLYSLYNSLKLISLMKYNTRKNENILFDKHYPNLFSKVQQPLTFLEYNIFVALIGSLSINKSAKDAI